MVRHSFILELRRYTEQDPCYGAMVLWSTLYPRIAHPCFADAGCEVFVATNTFRHGDEHEYKYEDEI